MPSAPSHFEEVGPAKSGKAASFEGFDKSVLIVVDYSRGGTYRMLRRNNTLDTQEAARSKLWEREGTAGLMKDLDDLGTRSRIKVCSRRLFAERGVEAVTVREIVAASGAKNGGSLNYYFKSKDGLILELLAEMFRESSDGWLTGLSELDKRGGANSVRDVVEVLVKWPDEKTFTDPSPTANRFFHSLLFTRRQMVRDFLEKMNFAVFARLLSYIAELKSDLPKAAIQQRLIFVAWYIISTKAAYETYLASGRRNNIWTDFDPLDNIVDTAVGLIEAPCSQDAAPATKKKRGQKSLNSRDSVMRQALDAAFPK